MNFKLFWRRLTSYDRVVQARAQVYSFMSMAGTCRRLAILRLDKENKKDFIDYGQIDPNISSAHTLIRLASRYERQAMRLLRVLER